MGNFTEIIGVLDENLPNDYCFVDIGKALIIAKSDDLPDVMEVFGDGTASNF